jgi:hypothetical protein
MIEWMTLGALEEKLASYEPIGLALRSFFQAQIPASLKALFEREPETVEVAELGQTMSWSGFVNEVPFIVMAQRKGELTGFEISFPTLLDEGRIHLGLLEHVTTLAPVFRTLRTAHVASLPFTGEGWGVVKIGGREPMFRSRVRTDVEAVAQFLDEPTRFEIKALPAAPAQWLVVGPRMETTVSRLEVVATKEEADKVAAAWSEEFGGAFEVHEGQLPA